MPIKLSQKQKIDLYRMSKVKQDMAFMMALEMLTDQVNQMVTETISKSIPEIVSKAQELKLVELADMATRNVLKDMKGSPGEPGHTPKKGIDYMTKGEIMAIANEVLSYARPVKGRDYMTAIEREELIELVTERIEKPEDGKTPKAGIDYPTHDQIIKTVLSEIKKNIKTHGMTFGKVKDSEMSKNIKDKLATNEYLEIIARGIEKLPLEKKLDYNYGLKNQPGVKLYDSNKTKGAKRLGRGTGSDVKAYDISSSLNGVLKTFSIPSNTRILSVTSSSFPTTFRPTVDYTSTGSTITFTSEVDAGTTLASGQTLIIVYVE